MSEIQQMQNGEQYQAAFETGWSAAVMALAAEIQHRKALAAKRAGAATGRNRIGTRSVDAAAKGEIEAALREYQKLTNWEEARAWLEEALVWRRKEETGT